MKKVMKIALINFITSLRLIGTLLLIPVYTIYGGIAAAGVSAFCYITDFVDGFLARRLKCSTFFGSLFDGACDKSFNIICFLSLLSITPLALIPVFLELAIIAVNGVKYSKNHNVQSNIIGKFKMLIAGITMPVAFMLTDKFIFNYLSASLAEKLSKLSSFKLFSILLTPLIISEIATLSSYIGEYQKNKEENVLDKENNDIIEEEKINIEELENISTIDFLFKPEVYEKYKDSDGLKLVLKKVKKK
ncbi:MAG: hypothetical protein E7172_00455 [Firmicutes bacterium]|nr:hypothetical protein [Bacillota bacterium]